MSYLTPEGYLPLLTAVGELAHQIDAEAMDATRPPLLERVERMSAAMAAKAKAGSITNVLPRSGEWRGPIPGVQSVDDLVATVQAERATWAPIEQRQSRARAAAVERIRGELAAGRLKAEAMSPIGELKPIGPKPWRVVYGAKAMQTGRMQSYPDEGRAIVDVSDWPVFLPERAFREVFAEHQRARIPDDELERIVTGFAKEMVARTGLKITQGAMKARLIEQGFSDAEANRGARMIPVKWRLGRGDHRRAPPSRLAAPPKPAG